ncbi:MAG: 16S rRNA (cytidine(1402)-2'-O)-methyltransferase, partial [Clostridia bacterium]|nr:16S rRNA (cytidine(1402)-2'-O)-methyltransferase [Clostridia bacterium]
GGKLYVVGTPIGNLGDMSPRAVETLEKVDFIAAEDTRVTVKLLNHFDIKKEMLSYYEHNKNQKGNLIIERMLKGESCAVVSDAGMPAISDPGEDLVRKARESGIEVESVPGPSALITAISISGFPCGRFCFEGFLSMNKISRRSHLEELKTEKRTMVFYEAPHKLSATLKDMLSYFGDRKIVLVRELTKIHETVKHWTLKEAAEYYSENAPKGEFVLIVEGKKEEAVVYTADEAVALAKKFVAEGKSTSAAAKEASEITGIKKGDIYKSILKDD